ncbi:MAG TPA: ATP-binding protein [Ktedonobacteraceae bacterium]
MQRKRSYTSTNLILISHIVSGRQKCTYGPIEDQVARVAVHNEGAHIPPEEQQHLWERFYRAKGSAVQHELDLSVGLGFYLCKVFIERNQGSIGVQSAPGQGATFWFTVPLATSGEGGV